jgi:DNA-binding MarR family transcriptional regulator
MGSGERMHNRAAKSGAQKVRLPGSASNKPTVSRRLPALLHRLASLLVDETSPYFRTFGLTIPATRVMIGLLENGGSMTVGNLSESLSIDLSTTSHILRRLEKQGYLARQRLDHDNRLVSAGLTAEGRRVAEKCRNASLRHEAALIGDMSEQQVALFRTILEDAYKNARKNLKLDRPHSS